jgi:hypothetical protein
MFPAERFMERSYADPSSDSVVGETSTGKFTDREIKQSECALWWSSEARVS